ncbi:SUN-family protein [Neisseria meningitidis]|nr:SUN-family protein [Neisseria meningitidis]
MAFVFGGLFSQDVAFERMSAFHTAVTLQSLKVDLHTGKYLRLNSGEHQTDGFFAAVLQRK